MSGGSCVKPKKRDLQAILAAWASFFFPGSFISLVCFPFFTSLWIRILPNASLVICLHFFTFVLVFVSFAGSSSQMTLLRGQVHDDAVT